MTRKWNVPLTYPPKIEPVKAGTCTQTIRTGRKYAVGDLIRFYVWGGRPYHSKRETITEYMSLVDVKNCIIRSHCIDDLHFQGEFGMWFWDELDTLAELDGIVPPTGEALRDVLVQKNGRIPAEGIEAQVIRWDPGQRGMAE